MFPNELFDIGGRVVEMRGEEAKFLHEQYASTRGFIDDNRKIPEARQPVSAVPSNVDWPEDLQKQINDAIISGDAGYMYGVLDDDLPVLASGGMYGVGDGTVSTIPIAKKPADFKAEPVAASDDPTEKYKNVDFGAITRSIAGKP